MSSSAIGGRLMLTDNGENQHGASVRPNYNGKRIANINSRIVHGSFIKLTDIAGHVHCLFKNGKCIEDTF